MKYVSLFAGIGGFDKALNDLGHECVYVNEWDKYSAQTYEKNFCFEAQTERIREADPEGLRKQTDQSDHEGNTGLGNSGTGIQQHIDRGTIRQYDNRKRNGHPKVDTRSITDVSESDIPDHDLLVGGFPCQAFSIAGKRQGFNDTRGTLFFDVARIIKTKRPRYLILENVKGLLSHDSGRTFKTILSTLTELGYDIQTMVLNSKNFGVPQNRERVFIIGNLRGIPRPKVFPFGENARLSIKRQGQISPTITQRYYKQGQSDPYIVTEKPKTGKSSLLKNGDQSNNIDTRGGSAYPTNLRIRRLTPLECLRLQGFPDDWFDVPGLSDTQKYKQAGNAVTVNVVYEIMKRFL